MCNTHKATVKVAENKSKLFKRIFISFITAFILFCIVGYIFVNRGVSIEIANNIEVGKDIVIPSADGDLRGSLFMFNYMTSKRDFKQKIRAYYY